MKLGPYDVLATIGRGGMGVVLRARTREGGEVAVKVLNRGGDTQRFDRERRLLETLGEAQGFVPLLDAGVAEAGHYLVMPFLSGGTLRQRVERGALSIDETVALGKKLAAALAKAHERGIVHRDLKPENVLFTAAGEPLVADVGLAKHFDRDMKGASQSVSLSRDGQILGTAGYMPIEQLKASSDVGPPADVFALGAILYECLAGAPAFPGDNMVEILAKLETGIREPTAKARPDAPAWLALVVERALAYDAKDRFADAAALRRALASEERPRSRKSGVLLAVAALVAASGVAASAALFLPRGAAATASPRLVVPPLYEPLAVSRRLELTGFWGAPSGKHAAPAGPVVFTPDGRFLVSGGDDSAIRIFDAATGREERVLEVNDGGVRALSLAKDGRRLVSASGSNRIEVWDLETGRLLRTIGPLRNYLSALAILPDGRRALAAGCDADVVLYDLDAGIALDHVDTGQTKINDLALSPDGARFATAGDDKSVRVLDVASMKELARLDGHLEAVTAVAFSKDGAHLVSGSAAQGVRAWDARTFAPRWSMRHGEQVTAVAVSPDGRRAASGGEGRTVIVWDLASGETRFVLDGGARYFRGLAFSPDSRRLAASGLDGATRVWELPGSDAGAPRELWPAHGHRGPVAAVAISDDGTRVASAGQDGFVRVRDAKTGDEVRALGDGATGLGGVIFSPDGKRVVTGGWDGALRVFEVASGREVKVAVGHANMIVGLALLADGKRFVSAGREGTLRVWELDTLRPLRTIAADPDFLEAFAVDVSRRRLFAAGRDGKVKEWDVESGVPIAAVDVATGQYDAVEAIAADADAHVFTCTNDERVRVWDWSRRVVARTLAKQSFRCFGISFLGPWLVTVRASGPLVLNALDSGEKLDELPFTPVLDQPSSLAVARDGRFFVLGTMRGLVLRYERRE